MIITSFANVNEFEIRRSAVMPAIRNETGVEEDSSMNVLKLTQFIFYTLSGLSAVICSLIIIFTIFLNKSLRNKDFYLLAALAGSDLLRGYGYLHGGILRMVFVSTGSENVQVSPSDCMMQVYQTFMLFGQQCSPMMVFILALDRFLAVAFFAKYCTFGTKYALALISISYGTCFIVTSFAWVSALTMMPAITVARTCMTETVTPLPYFTFHVGTRCLPGLLSIILYIITVVMLKTKNSTNSVMRDVERKRQTRLTINVALISLSTILFMTFPFGYTFLSYVTGRHTSTAFQTISPFLWSLSLFGAAANLFIYSWKYGQFRNAISHCSDVCRRPVQVVPLENYLSVVPSSRKHSSIQLYECHSRSHSCVQQLTVL